jgi:hypothetical protein
LYSHQLKVCCLVGDQRKLLPPIKMKSSSLLQNVGTHMRMYTVSRCPLTNTCNRVPAHFQCTVPRFHVFLCCLMHVTSSSPIFNCVNLAEVAFGTAINTCVRKINCVIQISHIFCVVILNAVISGSLSLQHGASSGCGWRNGLQYGG